MFDKIKRLGAETAIYGISTILGRFLSFLLLPLYTNILPKSDYGVVANVYSYIAFLNVVYGLGMESAFFKYASTRELGDEKEVFGLSWLTVTIGSVLFSLLILWNATPLSYLVARGEQERYIVIYAVGILFFDAVSLIPFAALRLQKRPWQFAGIRVAGIILNVVLNAILLAKFRMGVAGIFVSGIISSLFTALCLFPTIVRHIALPKNSKLFSALLKFGLPYVPAGLAGIALQVIDRPILRALTDDASVGIYQANYRLGIFIMLIVSMFDYAWRPFFLSNAKEPDAKKMFARIATYFFLLLMFGFLVIAFFIGDLVGIEILHHRLIHPAYWPGLGIVPIVLLAYVFTGVYVLLIPGIYIEKKTQFLPLTSGLGAVTNIGMNLLLIPLLGFVGAAWSTLGGYLVMALSLYFIVQRYYPVRYEFRRMGVIAVSTGIIFCIFVVVGGTLHAHMLVKIGLLIGFIGLMALMRFFDPAEIHILKALFQRKTPPSDIPPSIMSE
ncbi:MAG: oligosaccharide flippase family protein [Bacteroidota bacterium]